MKTNLIEITVSGRTGSGKSRVLEVIRKALESEPGYPPTCVEIAEFNPDGAIDEASVNTANTVFVLYEQNVSGENCVVKTQTTAQKAMPWLIV